MCLILNVYYVFIFFFFMFRTASTLKESVNQSDESVFSNAALLRHWFTAHYNTQSPPRRPMLCAVMKGTWRGHGVTHTAPTDTCIFLNRLHSPVWPPWALRSSPTCPRGTNLWLDIACNQQEDPKIFFLTFVKISQRLSVTLQGWKQLARQWDQDRPGMLEVLEAATRPMKNTSSAGKVSDCWRENG